MVIAQGVIYPLAVWLAPASGERGRLALALAGAFALMLFVNRTVAALARRRLARLAEAGELMPDLRRWIERRVRLLAVLRFGLAALALVFVLRATEDPHVPHRVLWSVFAAGMIGLLAFVQAVALPRVRRERADLARPEGPA